MSAGTRKKIVDFQKLVDDKLTHDELDFYYSGSNKKSSNKSKILKNDKSFLGHKRNNKIMYHKNEQHSGNKQIIDFFFKKNEEIVRKVNIYSFRRRKNISSFGEKDYLDKNEHVIEIEKNEDELNNLGIDLNIKKDVKSINSDLANLYIKLFNLSKFENSKPYKMIDYIVNSDKSIMNSNYDKEIFEDIKKTVSNFKFEKSETHNEKTIPIFKSLYHFFKADFSSSYLLKIFEKVNSVLNESQKFNDENGHNKDKFTYQNYLTEKLKNYNDFFSEINDIEIFKAMIYLCNKNNKSNTRFTRLSKVDTDFENILKDNVKCIDDYRYKPDMISKLNNIVENDIKADKFIKKRLNKLFFNVDDLFDSKSENKIFFSKIIELFCKSKEDELDKIISKLNKIELFSDKSSKNILMIWVYFRFFYFWKILSNNSEFISDEVFWKDIVSNVYEFNTDEEKTIAHKKFKRKGRKCLKIDKKLLKLRPKVNEFKKENILLDNLVIRNNILSKLKEKKPLFRISKDQVNKFKKETKIIIKNNIIEESNDNSSERVIQPKTVNVAQGKIIINNYYNIINQAPTGTLDINTIKQFKEEVVLNGTKDISLIINNVDETPLKPKKKKKKVATELQANKKIINKKKNKIVNH